MVRLAVANKVTPKVGFACRTGYLDKEENAGLTDGGKSMRTEVFSGQTGELLWRVTPA